MRVGDLGGFPQALGSAWRRTNLAFMAGGGAPCPEGKTLKALPTSLSAGFHPPAAGPMPARLWKAKPKATTMNMHVAVPGKPQDTRARNLATQNRRREKSLQRLARLRREAGEEIDRLIAFLDATDPYASTELERNDDDEPQQQDDEEPSLAGVSAHDMKRFVLTGCHSDDHELDDSDDEPSLAAPENHPNCWAADGSQERWATAGNRDDREGDGCADDREGDELLHGGEAMHEDDEPSLGWTSDEAGSGRYRGVYGAPDLERAVL